MRAKLARNMTVTAMLGVTALAASAAETIVADFSKAYISDKRANEKAEGFINGDFSVKLDIAETGTHRVWVWLWVPENKRANMALKIDAPTGESVWYERVDFLHGLPSHKPYEKREITRPEGDLWHSFDVDFEYAGEYKFNVMNASGNWGGSNLRTKGIWVSNAKDFDPRRNPAAATAAQSSAPAAAAPQGFVPVRELPLHADYNTGVSEITRRFRAACHQNYPVYFAPGFLVNLGYTFEQNTYGIPNFEPNEYGQFYDRDYGLKGGNGFRGDLGELWGKYPGSKKDDPSFIPVGRKANADGKYWHEWSYSFAEANELAYRKEVEDIRKIVAGPVNSRIESWQIAWEEGGTYDYGAASVAAFHKFLAAKYGDIATLNRAWHTEYKAFADILPAKRDDVVGDKRLADPLERARQTANFIDFRDFCSKEYARNVIDRRVRATLEADPEKRPVYTQFANLDLNAVEWSGWRPLDMEDLMRIGMEKADRFGYDVYAADDWAGAEYDTLSAFGYDKKRMEVREGSTHTPDPVLAVRTYWTLVGKGIKGFSNFMLQEGNNNAEFPKFGLTNYDQSPRPKLAAYSDAIRAIHQIERQLMDSRRTHAHKPIAIYYSRTCNALQERSYGSLFDAPPDNVFRVYELMRANGYPVTFITDTQIREKNPLEAVQGVVFLDAKYVPSDVIDILDGWVSRGGHVLADSQPGIYDGHGFPQDKFIRLLGIDPVESKRVDRMAADQNAFGYSAVSFDVVNSDRLHRTQFEMFQQFDSTHPVSRALGNFMFSGFGYQQVDCTDGEVIVMAHNGRPGTVIRPHGKGTFTYFAGYLGTLFGGACSQYEWRDAHSENSPYRFMDAYLAHIGARPVATTGLDAPRKYRMRLEAPLVDSKGNAILSMTNYGFEDSGDFDVAYTLPREVKAPRQLFALTSSSRKLQKLDFTHDGDTLRFTMPSFLAYGAVLAVNDTEPLVSIDTGDAPRAPKSEGSFVELKPGRTLTMNVTVHNTTDKTLDAGTVTLRMPRGWFYDRETAPVPALKPGESSPPLAFTVRTPPVCARDNVRPMNFLYESGNGVKSMPTAETVWWKK